MICPKCKRSDKMVALFTGMVCDRCDPPKGAAVAREEPITQPILPDEFDWADLAAWYGPHGP